MEQPIVRKILADLPVGVALDAGCGTGRHTEYLASLGHEVIGVASSTEMLARAREKVPGGELPTGSSVRGAKEALTARRRRRERPVR